MFHFSTYRPSSFKHYFVPSDTVDRITTVWTLIPYRYSSCCVVFLVVLPVLVGATLFKKAYSSVVSNGIGIIWRIVL